jgi:hypothetical protein
LETDHVSPSSPPDEKGRRNEPLPNSSALINLFADASLTFAFANGEPFPVLGSLFLKSFSYRREGRKAVSSRVYREAVGRCAVYTVIDL